uniref:LNS2/PITP domain-containing protein n=1 Tax=Picocystis salinarum TaxID=88271 RepID=A0A7S3XFC2_9CHLO
MDPTRGRNESEEEEARMLDEWIRIQDEEIAMELDAYEAMEEMDGILSPTSGYSSGEEPPYATAAHAGPISQAEANAVLEATKQSDANETLNAAVSPRAAAGQRALQQAGERQADGTLVTSTTCQPVEWESMGERADGKAENRQLPEQVQLDLVVLEGICKVNLWVVPSKEVSTGTACSRKQNANRIAPKGLFEEPRKSKAAHRLFYEQDTIPEDSIASMVDGGESVSSSPRDGAGRGSEENNSTQNHEVEGIGAIKTTGDGGNDKEAVEPVTPSKNVVVQVDWKEFAATGLELSMCGHLLERTLEEDAINSIFSEHILLESAFKENSESILESPNLVCRIQGQIVPFQMLLPAIIGGLAYNLPVSIPSDLRPDLPAASVGQALVISKEQQKSEGWSKIFWPFNRNSSARGKQKKEAVEEIAKSNEIEAGKVEGQQIVLKPRNLFQGNSHRYRRSLTPTSEQLASMGLQDGRNLITFTFKTSMWGIQQVQCYLYLINWDSKLVVTDVDGTITKSDMLGHLMPIVGKDWSHSGVANLFTNIKENGYVVVYLSSRSIGQASRTRDYLMNVIQDGEYLPYGPVLISPDGIFPSLYREVVLKRPHEFKINCLQNVKSLFPDDWSPFYAGFGNRPTDQLSYESVGIPRVRIFTINSKSEVVSAASTVKGAAWSSFTSINTFVDQMFPCMLGEKGLHEEFGDVNFWRVPVMELGEEDIETTENEQGARALVQKEGTPKAPLQSPDKKNLQPEKAPAAEGKQMDRAFISAED